MAKCRACVMVKPGQLAMQEFDIPKVAEDCALIKIEACGICGTDKHCFEGHRQTAFPIIAGHEFVGTVVELGKRANDCMGVSGGPLAVGDRVTVSSGSLPCGHCHYCLTMPQRSTFCTNRSVYGYRGIAEAPGLWGGFSEYMYLHPKTEVFKVPKSMPMKRAVLIEPVASAMRGVERAYNPGEPFMGQGYGIGKSAMVLGTGPIGVLVVACLRHSGAGLIIAQDIFTSKLETAKKMGADVLIDGRLPIEERLKKVQALTDGVGPDVVIEAAGVPIAFREALEFVRRGGKLIEMGNATKVGTTDIFPYTICNKDLDIHGSWAYPGAIFRDAISLLERTSLPVEDLVTHVMPLEDLPKGMKLTGSEGVGKVAIVP